MHIAQLSVAAVVLATAAQSVQAGPAHDAYFATLSKLCGASFEGASVFPNTPGDPFTGKLLVAKVVSCTADEIRIPFVVGEDRSRTWIIRKEQGALTLKHDHRHADGTPDQVTMYGGLAGNDGSALSQSFRADDHTAKLIPGAVTNVWTMSLSSDGRRFTYYLERDAKPRFKAELTRQ